jgi:hypothetical protein
LNNSSSEDEDVAALKSKNIHLQQQVAKKDKEIERLHSIIYNLKGTSLRMVIPLWSLPDYRCCGFFTCFYVR